MLQTETPQTYQAPLIPTGQHNRRKVRCATCHVPLPAGTGQQWDWSSGFYLLNAHPYYYCPACHAKRQALLEIQPEVVQTLAVIQKWCNANVTADMGWIVEEQFVAVLDVLKRIAAALETIARNNVPSEPPNLVRPPVLNHNFTAGPMRVVH